MRQCRILNGMSDVSSPEPSHYDSAVDTLAASQVMRDLAAQLHDDRRNGEFNPRIGYAEANAKEGVQRAVVLSNLAQADNLAAINRTLVVGLDGIAQRLADLIELFDEALEANTNVMSGSHEGEDRA